MSHLPKAKATCPRCSSEDLKLCKEVREKKFIRQTLTFVRCNDCEWESERKHV